MIYLWNPLIFSLLYLNTGRSCSHPFTVQYKPLQVHSMVQRGSGSRVHLLTNDYILRRMQLSRKDQLHSIYKEGTVHKKQHQRDSDLDILPQSNQSPSPKTCYELEGYAHAPGIHKACRIRIYACIPALRGNGSLYRT